MTSSTPNAKSSLLDEPIGVAVRPHAPSRWTVPVWLQSNRAKIWGSIGMLLVAVVILISQFSGSDPAASTRTRTAIDSVTGKIMEVPIIEGESSPWKNPDTGEHTLYPAEKCFWTRDGKAKLTPTLVLVKSYLGSKEKTFCPDCGREVISHNPTPPGELFDEALGHDPSAK